MKSGDLVRFRSHLWRPWCIGLLIEYHTWEKIATVMYKSELIRIQARNVEKAGRKDCERHHERVHAARELLCLLTKKP